MFKLKKIIKLFVFIIIIKTSFLVSFAFIGDDLGLNLYRNIDKGITDLNEKMYSNELKGDTPNGKISDKVNQFIKRAGINGCKIGDLTEADIEKISYGNISLLSKKLDGKCQKIEQLNKIQKVVKNYSKSSLKTAKQKSQDIYNISKMGLFSDGSIKNSPFDIVKDIKDIDYIIFTQDVKYDGEENVGENKLSKYLNNKLDNLQNKLNNSLNNNSDNNNNNTDSNGENSKGNNNGIIDEIINGEEEGKQNQNGNNGEFTCPIPDKSGLSKKDLNNILNGNNSDNGGTNNSGNINGNINSNYKGNLSLGDNPFSFTTGNAQSAGGIAGSNIGKTNYKKVNDNDYFGGCKTFFCITIEFVKHQGNLLIGGKTRSIESIIERSNKHLKKFANSSLVQSKMTTNNFELGLRDLKLPDILSMPIVFVKKSPPFLDLDFFDKKTSSKEKENPDPLSRQNLLKERFDAVGMDIKRENDLSIFTNSDANIKNTINNAEMSTLKAKENNEEVKEKYEKLSKLDDHITRIIQSNYQAGDTDGLYKEFIELEKFTSEIQNYVNNVDKILNKMLAIPIHP